MTRICAGLRHQTPGFRLKFYFFKYFLYDFSQKLEYSNLPVAKAPLGGAKEADDFRKEPRGGVGWARMA